MRRLALIALASVLALGATAARAHLEDMPEALRMTVHVHRDGAELGVLVRTPLLLLTNVGLPLRGEDSVDVDAFYADDPIVPGDATYAERASRAVLRALRLTAGGAVVELEADAVALVTADDEAPATFAAGRRRVRARSSATDTGADIRHHHGYLDVLASATLPADGGGLTLTPVVGPALAPRLVVEVRQSLGGGAIETHVLEEARGTLRLE